VSSPLPKALKKHNLKENVKEKQTSPTQQQQQQYPKLKQGMIDILTFIKHQMFVIRTSFRTHDPDEVPSLGCPSNQEPTLNKRGTTITTTYLHFFPLLRFFQNFLCSPHVPFTFPMCSQFVP
jgi:hypothetical protein